ncbi:phosphoribosylaminoimidazolesuccinocarboxamide synthase [Alicyclobacillus sp. SO9]|uniref:phosphoribosylaminoimidazolesuccinocarboxamide synthase n=1 Tax=Alicyclobacillus sp. SO9 TaxID=2665646 RepID=UPI0018E884B2|nr:phosphoribosylaminoimidazolesuccinocarboxamide synthase [Alicyclobacillus sp. SO9]QQE78570.1 phosphoribosylaminoimidazolesuccinocarboxamide synthase [Alicyclobacillus sp. SO9]
MEKGRMLYEGKAKKVYETDNPEYRIVSYKDDATAFNGEKKGTIVGKGAINNQMSNLLFQMLAKNGIPTHFVEELSERETVVKAVEIVPLEVVVRNVTAGSMAKRLGLEEGRELSHPIVEFYYKRDDLGDPLVTDAQIEVLELAPAKIRDEIREMALQVNELLARFMADRGILLVDFKLEFGVTESGELLLADEISPDTCRFWDIETKEKLDKDRFRRDLGNVEGAYQEMMKRVSEVQN